MPAKYMTLGPKFFCFNKVAVTRRRKHLNQQFLVGSPPRDVSYLSSLSKQDLKHFPKFDLLGFAVIVFHIVAKLMSKQIYIYICLNCFANGSEMLFHYFEMLCLGI